jgi:hypothetical protein
MSPAVARLPLLAFAALVCAACGNLDNVTTIKDLRVLAVKAEPAGFLVDLDQPGAAPAASLQATLTALVVDPNGNSQTLTYTAEGCADYIDTITAASGMNTKVCPPAGVTSQIPPPVGPALATTEIYPDSAPAMVQPDPDAPIQYHAQASYGFTPEQVGLFFAPQPTGVAMLDQSIAYNRDFGLDGIVDLQFTLGAEKVQAIKRVVYWPRLAADQQPNKNPAVAEVRFFGRQNATTGALEDPWDTPRTVSRAAGDKLFVLPIPAEDAIEQNYLLRVKNTQTNQIETQTIATELLNFQFFTSAGSFAPAQRQTEIDPFVIRTRGVPLESEYLLPADDQLPADGSPLTVTIWIIAHDERAGVDWTTRTIEVSR